MATHVLLHQPLRSTPATEKRRERRHQVDASASLRVLVPLSSAPEEVRIMDISTHGLCVRAKRRIYPHSSVLVQFAQTTLMGEVRYCRENAETFDIGVLICVVYDPVNKEAEIVRD